MDMHFPYQLAVLALLLLLGLLFVLDNVLLETVIALADDAFDGCEFAGFLLDAHGEILLLHTTLRVVYGYVQRARPRIEHTEFFKFAAFRLRAKISTPSGGVPSPRQPAFGRSLQADRETSGPKEATFEREAACSCNCHLSFIPAFALPLPLQSYSACMLLHSSFAAGSHDPRLEEECKGRKSIYTLGTSGRSGDIGKKRTGRSLLRQEARKERDTVITKL